MAGAVHRYLQHMDTAADFYRLHRHKSEKAQRKVSKHRHRRLGGLCGGQDGIRLVCLLIHRGEDFSFEDFKTDAGGARWGRLATPDGPIETPGFIPEGPPAQVQSFANEALSDV